MGTQYDNPENYVEMIDDVRCTINTIDEVISGHLRRLGIAESRNKTDNYSTIYNSLIPREDYKIRECEDFAYGLFVMHEIRNKFSHEERIAHSMDIHRKKNKALDEVDDILRQNEKHPFLSKKDSDLASFNAVKKELNEIMKWKSIDCLYREHEYWFDRYKDFLQDFYDRQEWERSL